MSKTSARGSGDTLNKVGSGGAEAVAKVPSIATPPPEIPDVTLVEDGFGFMPRETPTPPSTPPRRHGSKADGLSAEDQTPSSCSSSGSSDIVRRYTWTTKNRMTVQVITYGATITSIQVPDRKGVPDDVIAGFESLPDYMQPRNPYFGALIGRCANYVREGTMAIRPFSRIYMLSLNKGVHHYHGGVVGFDKVNWRSYMTGKKVIMSHVSQRYNEGYPGCVMTQICFEVSCENVINIEMRCTTSEPTMLNLSYSPYFNLAGHHSGNVTMVDHIFTINADKYTPTDDEDGLVTGERKVVGGTAFDMRVPRMLKCLLPKIPLGGYDVNYCVTQGTSQDLTFHARAMHPGTGRVLEVYSNQPGMQFYTGNDLPDPDKIYEADEGRGEEKSSSGTSSNSSSNSTAGEEGMGEEASGEEREESTGKKGVGYEPLLGKGGAHYRRQGLFCLMPQNYPDAINHKSFPNAILNPGEVYTHKIQYKFGILLGRYT